MSTYSSLLKTSNSLERLFRILNKIFLVMTIALAVLGLFVLGYFSNDLPYGLLDRCICIIYIMSPSIITLVLTIASYVAAKCAYNIRLELPIESDKK